MFNEAQLCEEETFDGYYVIVTSEWRQKDEEVIEIYRGLWQIEESFMVTKSVLETRPVYLSHTDHIEAHFLICFVALVIARLLAPCLDNKYSILTIVESLSKASGSSLRKTGMFSTRPMESQTPLPKNSTSILAVSTYTLYMRYKTLSRHKEGPIPQQPSVSPKCRKILTTWGS